MDAPVMVWRFVDYEGRYKADLPPGPAQMPQYLKWYINAWSGAGGEVLVALNRLRADREFIWLQGALIELLTVATNVQEEYQGYLVTSQKEPMQASNVGSVLRVDGRKALAVLTRLSTVGFLERVAWPFGGSDGPIPDTGPLRLLQDVQRAAAQTRDRGGGKGRSRGQKAGPDFKEGSKALQSAAQKEKTEVEGTARGRDAGPPEGGQAAGTLTCPNCGHVGKPANAGAKRGQCTQCRTIVANAPTSTSTSSTIPDAGAGLASAIPPARTSPHAGPRSIIRIEDARNEQPHKYSTAGNEFGQQVCAAYGYVTHEGGEYANEVAHWAKLFDDGLAGLSDVGRQKAVAKLLKVCGLVRGGHKVVESPGAYLERTLQNAIRDAKRAQRAHTG